MRLAASELSKELERVSGQGASVESSPAPPCDKSAIRIALLGHEHVDRVGGMDPGDLAQQQYVIQEERCDAGKRIVVAGGGILSAQWAVYDLLHRLGIRYFHPEQTWYPDTLSWPKQPLRVNTQPAFRDRMIHVSGAHPVELSPPLDPSTLDMVGYRRRWLSWNIKLRQNQIDSFGDQDFMRLCAQMGFDREVGLSLLGTQQGSEGLLHADDPRPEEQILAEAIEQRLEQPDDLGKISAFHFSYGTNEFVEADDILTVERMRFISRYLTNHHPEVKQYTGNHGTPGEPTAHFGVRFNDLAQFAPPELGVKVHLLMFYGLDRAAPVYGNESFEHQLTWIRSQATKRRIVYYPETSWWLTFDIPIPLYLAPVTLEARQRDIEFLRPLLAAKDDAKTGVIGHKVYSSGHEWGYWLVDYCVGRMTWDSGLSYQDCLADFTGILVKGDRVYRILLAIADRQAEDMRDPELIRFLVGSDDETELAYEAGIAFHPLAPGPASVLQWNDATVAALKTNSLVPLAEMAQDYRAWAGELTQILALQSEKQASWLREIRDGVAVFGLRAEHAVAVYQTALDLRDALRDEQTAAIGEAFLGVKRANNLTEQAREVIHRRELDYRYPPELTILGDEAGTPGAIPNRTTYPYRYLSRTHRLFYWERPNAQLAALFGQDLGVARQNARILPIDEPLRITVLLDDIERMQIAYGDGTVARRLHPHHYADHGRFAWALDVTSDGGVVHHEDEVSVVGQRYVFPKGSFKLQDYPALSLIEGLLPGYVLGLADDGEAYWVLGQLDDSSDLATAGSVVRRAGSSTYSGPADLRVPIAGAGSIDVRQAVLELDISNAVPTLRVSGQVLSADVADLLATTAAFKPEGAMALIASLLGYTSDTLPPSIKFSIVAKGYTGLGRQQSDRQ